jgi:two-component system, OmpR family, response regulator
LNQRHILLVEDDPEISESLARFLRDQGFETSVAPSAEAANEVLECGCVDLILLDLMLPGENGLDFCRRLQSSRGPRVIVLTALSESADKVLGLELGADDYICKPFDSRELLARVRAVLRRSSFDEGEPRTRAKETAVHFSGFAFYPQRRYLRSSGGLRIPLTGAETDLLLVFCQNPHQVLTREELINRTRGEGFAIAQRSVDMLVSRLRRKLGDNDPLFDPIRTVRTDGYVFQPQVAIE